MGDIPDQLEEAEGGLVVYQLTSYDWGTPDEQEEADASLAEGAADVDAELLLISMPPIEPDDFYEDHMDELETAEEAARTVAEDEEDVEFLDASAVWGAEYSREVDGEIDRSDDGIQVCPQGAARFTAWFMDELSTLSPEFEPADADT